MQRNVWLYNDNKKVLFYCVEDGNYYYKSSETAAPSISAGIAIVWSVLFRRLCDIKLNANHWIWVFIISNAVLMLTLMLIHRNERKRLHRYYPMKNEFLDNIERIKKSYRNAVIESIVLAVLIIISFYGWMNYSNRLIWLTIGIVCVMFWYCLVIINGLFFKKQAIKLIETGDI